MGEKEDIAFLDHILLRTKGRIERIDEAIAQELQRYADSRFYEPLAYAMENGKRIRPLILLLSAEAVGDNSPAPLDAAIAVELLHAESIIHDDIIDKEVSRRGREAFHVRYGYDTALLTEDFVFAMILSIAARYNDRRVANTLSTAALRMCEGELAELNLNPKKTIGWEEYTNVVFNKTASLFQTATVLGATIGGGKERQIEMLSNYGKYVGIAYQIHDDTLDFGTNDKMTAILERKKDGGSLIEQLKKQSGMYALKAKEELSSMPDGEAKQLLMELTDFTVERTV